jgi:hypothetical protein
MKFQLASRREEAVTVDGLGVLQPGEIRDVTEQEAEAFRVFRGLSLAQAGLPKGVDVTVMLVATDEDTTGGDE